MDINNFYIMDIYHLYLLCAYRCGLRQQHTSQIEYNYAYYNNGDILRLNQPILDFIKYYETGNKKCRK